MERIEKLKGFLEANPGDAFLKHALALEWIKLGDDAEARRVFEELLQDNPDYIGTYYHLAKLLERAGERDGALNWYRKGIEAATKAGDRHALGELQMAYDELQDDM
jgi:Tfp pilus assembly protein PilF